jgi:DNA replication protein DnaC
MVGKDIKTVWEEYELALQGTGFFGSPKKVSIRIDNAKLLLCNGLKYYCGEGAVWQHEYEEVAEWLTDNKGRGLWLCGECGRGKTLIGAKILPVLFNFYHFPRKIISLYDAKDLNSKFDDIVKKHIIYIDDVGKESVEVNYGNRNLRFPDIVDEAEKKGKLLMFSTNLSQEKMVEKYGERTVDRLRAITKKIVFRGKSLRK